MNKRFSLVSLCFSLGFVFLSLFFFSCEVGLGSAVDTQPPKITIQYPPVDSVIRESFELSGLASDETSVSSVKVTLKETNTGVSYGPYSASVDNTKKTWKITVNTPETLDDKITYPIKDGSYEVTVTATDTAGRTNSVNRTYIIDNTAPVLVIQNPSTKADAANPNVFGTDIKVVGQVSDQNEIDLLYFTSWDWDGAGNKKTTKATNIAQNMDIVLGTFQESGFYEEIYGNIDEGEKKYLFSVSVSDEARTYKGESVQQDPEERGNISEGYYLRNEIYSPVLKGMELSTKDLYAIKSGSYTGNTVNLEELDKELEKYFIPVSGDETKPGSFALNPKNNPTWSILGISALNLGNPVFDTSRTRSKNTLITISALIGLNETPLLEDSFGVVAYPCDDTGKITSQTPVVLVKTAAQCTTEAEITERAGLLEPSGDNYNINVPLDSLTNGNHYVIELLGEDQDSNEFDNGDLVYAILIATESQPPVINITEPQENIVYIKKDGFVTFKGTASAEIGEPSVYALIDNNTSKVNATGTQNWTIVLSGENFDVETGNSVSGVISFVAKAENGLAVTKDISYYYDVSSPEIEIQDPYPYVGETAPYSINGKVTVSGTVIDDDKVESVKYEVLSNSQVLESGNSVNTQRFSFELDTTSDIYKDKDKSFIDIVVTARDRAGNETSSSHRVKIDQSTDLPVITSSNASFEIQDKDSIALNRNLFSVSNNKLNFTVTDDDGVGSVLIKLNGTDDETFTKSGQPTTQSVTYTLPDTDGIYAVEVVATDKYGVKASSGVFYLAVDSDTPTITVESPVDGGFVSGNWNFTGKTSDNSGIKAVYSVEKDGEGNEVITSVNFDSSSGQWSDTYNVGTASGNFERKYRAEDKYGRTQDIIAKYSVDTVGPTLDVTTPSSGETYIKTENSFRITGTASDAQSIDGVYYILKDNSSTPGAPDDTWTKAALQGSNWQASLDLSSGNEGVYYLFISAVDSAHNITEPQMYKIYGDKNSPELVINQGIPFYSDGGEDSFLSGTVEDTYLESFTVTGGNSGSVPEISGNTWKLGLGDWPDGNYTLVFTARDKAGRETVKNASVVVDSGAPVVEFTSITPLVDANNRKDNVNGTITVKGTIVDDTSITATYTLRQNGVPVSGFEDVSLGSMPVSWSFTVDTTKLQDKAECTVEINAVDATNSRTTETYTVYVDQSTDRPVVSYSNMSTDGGTQNLFGLGNNNILGFFYDDDGLLASEVWIDSQKKYDFTDLGSLTTYQFNYDVSDLDEGEHSVYFVITDKNGLKVTTNMTKFAVDKNVPALTISTPQNEFKSGVIVIEGTAYDENGFTSVTVGDVPVTVVDGGGFSQQNINWTYNFDAGTETGEQSRTVKAVDKYGRSTEVVFKYKVDVTAPQIKNISYPSSTYVNLPDVPLYTVSGAASEENSGSGLKDIRYALVSGNGPAPDDNAVADAQGLGYWRTADGLTSWKASVDFTGLTAGEYTLYIRARDNAGNQATSTGKTITVDTDQPVLALTSPEQNKAFKDSFTLTGSVTDTNPGNVSVMFNGKSFTPSVSGTTWTQSISFSGISDGQYTVDVTASDLSGKNVKSSFVFVKDTALPAVTLSNISSDGTTNLIETTPKVYGTLSDAHAGLALASAVFLKNESGTFTEEKNYTFPASELSGKTSYNFTMDLVSLVGSDTLSDGQWKIRFTLSDGAGNSGTSESAAFMVDRNNPTVTISKVLDMTDGSAVDQYVSKGVSYRAEGTAQDNGGLKEVRIQLLKDNKTVQLDGSDYKLGTLDAGGNWTCEIGAPFTESGVYNLVVTAVDLAGRTREEKLNLLSDTAAPAITFTSPFAKDFVQVNYLIGNVVVAGSSSDDAMAYTAYAVGGELQGDTVTKINSGTLIPWTTLDGGTYNWRFEFDTTNYDKSELAYNDSGSVWTIPVHIKAVDLSGNIAYETLNIKIDTDKDKPIVDITYPSDNSIVGGQFRVTGEATDNEAVYRVFMQVEVEGAVYNGNELTGFAGVTKSGGMDANGESSEKYFTKIGDSKDAWYAIDGTASWSFALNSLNEFNKEELVKAGVTFTSEEQNRENSDTTTKLIVRVKAQDSKDHGSSGDVLGLYDEIRLTLQSGAPAIIENKVPDANTYVSGSVPVDFTIKDDEAIDSVTVTVGSTPVTVTDSTIGSGVTSGSFIFTPVGDETAQGYYREWRVTGSFDSTKYSGSVVFTIEATDYSVSGQKTSTNTRTLFVDNTPPDIKEMGTGFYLMDGDGRKTSSEFLDMMGTRSQINGQASDSGSGIGKVILYLTNTDDTVLYSLGGGASGEEVDISGTSFSTTINTSTGVIPFPVASLDDILTGKTNGIPQNYIVVDKLEGGDDNTDVGDRDGYNEHLAVDGSWYVKLNSNNVRDGEYHIHYVAVDKAGNINYKRDNVRVANNAPTIESLVLYTDIDINGTIEDDEKIEITARPVIETDPVSGATIVKSYEAVDDGFVVRNSKFRMAVTSKVENGIKEFTVTAPGGTTLDAGTLSGTTKTWNVTAFGTDSSSNTDKKVFTIKVTDNIDLVSKDLEVKVLYKNKDSEKPKTWFYEFDTEEWDGRSTGTGSIHSDGGHIELRDDSLFDNDSVKDPDVSGTILLRGKTTDDQRLSSVTVSLDGAETTILEWNGSSMAPKTGVTLVSEELGLSGHTVEWIYKWDTATINGVAKKNVNVSVSAGDAGSNTSDTLSYSDSFVIPADPSAEPGYNAMTVDVVPYIGEVETGLSNLKRNNPSVYNRTVKGYYSVNSKETIEMTGYNLAGATLYGGAVSYSRNGNTLTVNMANALSGNLDLVVNGVPLLNNNNDNTKEYNKCPNNDNNNLLTDDVVFDVWDINSEAVKANNNLVVDPVMKINPANDLLGFAFANGANYFSMANGTSNSYTLWQRNYDDFYLASLAYDESGKSYGTLVGRDIYSGDASQSGHGGRFSFITSKWGIGGIDNDEGNYTGPNQIRLESIGVPIGTYVNGEISTGRNLDKSRIRSPSLAVSSHGGETSVYLAYYDNINEQIRFRYMKNVPYDYRNGADQFKDQITVYGNKENSNTVFESSLANYSVVAGNPYLHNNNSSATGVPNGMGKKVNNAGEYLALGVIPGGSYTDDVVVLVWYDGSDLYYSYKVDPCNDNDAGVGTGDGYWSQSIKLMEGAGQYCALSVDPNGGIHIAAYDIQNADLKYCYLESYIDSNPEVVTVDSYGIVGEHITIDTALDENGRAVPYISYYMASTVRPKIAYLLDPSKGYAQPGVNLDTEEYTGNWEISIIPSDSGILKDRINVGVWKDSSGKIKNSTKKNDESDEQSGVCYGNGTKNPITGYAIKVGTKGFIETAQRR